jgi:hypothetical protein
MMNELAKDAKRQYAIVDTINMKNFKEMLPDPAISYPFELDDF